MGKPRHKAVNWLAKSIIIIDNLLVDLGIEYRSPKITVKIHIHTFETRPKYRLGV